MLKFIRPFNKTLSFKALLRSSCKYSFNDLKKLNEQQKKLTYLLSQSPSIRLWSLQQIQHSQVRNSVSKSHNHSHTNIVVNKYFSTLSEFPSNLQNLTNAQKTKSQEISKYKNLIETLNQSRDWVFLPNFYNIFTRNSQTQNKGLNLLIGDYNEYFMSLYAQNMPPFITLEELCAIFPEKVPLSYRSRQNIQNIKKTIEARLNGSQQIDVKKLDQEPKFSQIIICNDKIKMWDQAYQIMLDELPCKITVPFHCQERKNDFYKLNLQDFIEGFETSHKIIHPSIPLEIDHQNCYAFLKEVLQTLDRDPQNKLKNHYNIELMDEDLQYKRHDNSLSSSSFMDYMKRIQNAKN